ncbi:MAG: phosphopantetheine adenylyltransferase [Candidatus Bathyarchaeia archaeon]
MADWDSGSVFKKVAVGGTFDMLHKGHRKLLEVAFTAGSYVLIGLSSDSFVRKLHKPHKVGSYRARLEALLKFLRAQGWVDRAKIIPIEDRFGVAASDPELEAIVVSVEKRDVAKEINDRRVEIGLKPLNVLSVDMVMASDNRPISTTRIRRGLINREGKLIKRLKDD